MNHIEYSNCPDFNPAQAMDIELARVRDGVRPFVIQPDIGMIEERQDWCRFMINHCMMCGKWATRHQDMFQHLRLEHPDEATQIQGLYQHWISSRRSPCDLCQVSFQGTHQCRVLLQVAVMNVEEMKKNASLKVHHHEDCVRINPHPHTHEHIQSEEVHIRIHCADILPDQHELHERLRAHDRFVWGRDTTAGLPTCSHCKTIFCEMWELKRHIDRQACKCVDLLYDPPSPPRKDQVLLDAMRCSPGIGTTT